MLVKRSFMLLLLSLLLSACAIPREIEESGIINSRGVDINERDDNAIETTIVAYQFSAQSQEISTILTGTGNTIKAAREDAGYNTSFPLSPGQIRLEMYGLEAAKSGLLQYISGLVRDARASDTMLLSLSDTTAKEVIEKGQENVTMSIGIFIHDMIETEIEEYTIPDSSVHAFTHLESDIGHDPTLPIISIMNDQPKITALALFRRDEYVGSIPLDDAYLISLFQKKTQDTPLDLTLPVEPFKKLLKKYNTPNEFADEIKDNVFHINARITEGKSKAKITSFENLEFEANVNLKLDMYETSALFSVKTEETAKLIEKEIAKEIKRQYEELFTNLQELNSDPFGLGSIYRAHKRGGKLTNDEWSDLFPEAKVNFNVNVELMHYGTIQ